MKEHGKTACPLAQIKHQRYGWPSARRSKDRARRRVAARQFPISPARRQRRKMCPSLCES